MALKLIDYKTKVSSVQLQLRKFTGIKKVYRFYSNVDVEVCAVFMSVRVCVNVFECVCTFVCMPNYNSCIPETPTNF